MKIAVLSDTRQSTKPSGGHGLGRVAWDIAQGLANKGHDLTLYGGEGTESSGAFYVSVTSWDETRRAGLVERWLYDAYIDLSHLHDLSRIHPDWPVVNYIMDFECRYQPPRCVVGTEWMRANKFPSARIVPLGIDVDAIPFYDGQRSPVTGKYLAFCHKMHSTKGVDVAMDIAKRLPWPRAVVFAGALFSSQWRPSPWVGEITNDVSLYAFLGEADGLLSPCMSDAGGRVNLEAAACGTPVLCMDWTGTQGHVEHGVSGFICRDADEMVDAIDYLPMLDRRACREWVASTHSLKHMIDGIEALAVAARDGEQW